MNNFAEVKVGRNHVAIIDLVDFPLVSGMVWHMSSTKNKVVYAQANLRLTNGRRTTIAMHQVIMGNSGGKSVDHIDGDGLNNRRANLRHVTRQQNEWNGPSKGGTSQYKGVCFDKQSGGWRATIRINGKKRHLGRFADETDAARAYNLAASELFGEYGRLNHV